MNTLAILVAGVALANRATRIVTSDSGLHEIAKVAGIDVVTYRH